MKVKSWSIDNMLDKAPPPWGRIALQALSEVKRRGSKSAFKVDFIPPLSLRDDPPPRGRSCAGNVGLFLCNGVATSQGGGGLR